MQPPAIKPWTVLRIEGERAEQAADEVAVESAVTFFANDVEVATLLCSPTDVEALAVGFLLGEGILTHREELLSARHNRGRGTVRLKLADTVDLSPFTGERKGTLTSGCGKGQTYTFIRDMEHLTPLPAGPVVPARDIMERVKRFIHRSDTYQRTGGVHSAMLWDGDGLEVFAEDLGRHNAVDKVFGRCLLEGVDPAGKLLLTSGRISSEIAVKCARARVPIAVSRNAPTSFSVTLARTLDLTLVGFVRGSRMNVYTCPERIKV